MVSPSFMFLYSKHQFLVNVLSVSSADVSVLVAKVDGIRPRYTDCPCVDTHPNEGSAALLSLHVSMSFTAIHSSSSPHHPCMPGLI